MVPRGLITTGTVSTATSATTRQRRALTKQGRVQAPLVETKDAVRANASCLHATDVGVGVVDASQGKYRQSNTRSSRDLLVSSIAPVSLLGGTAVVYSAVLKNPSSTLTPLSLVYMVLLALQYTLQPRLSKRYISPKTNKQSVALAEETVKTAIAAVMFCASRSASASASASTATTTIQQELSQWNLQSSLAIAGLPAVLYAIQGVWQYTAHQYIDPVTFNGLSQTKTLWAAACCYLILGQSQSVPQMGALILLFVSALLFQGAFTTTTTTTTPPTSTTASTTSSISPRFPARSKDWFIKGIFPCLGAAICSGLAGALSQRGLQLTGGHGRDAYLYTMEISVFSALTLLVSLMLPSLSSSSRRPVTTTTKETKKRTWSNPLVLEGWTRATWIPIIWKAAGGVLTALVHQSSGSVAKGFALMLGLVLSGVLQSFIQEEEILPHQVAGTLFVMLSGWVHFTK